MKRESVIDPVIEKPLLRLHRAMNVSSFWKAVQRLFSASIANHSIGLSLRQNPNGPVIAKWTRSIPDDFFSTEALKRCAAPRKKLVRLNDLFRNRSSFVRSGFIAVTWRRGSVPTA